jgi:hypothetical protein
MYLKNLYNVLKYIYIKNMYVEAVNAAPSTGEIRQCIVRNLCKDL